jgi:hypothetical protein
MKQTGHATERRRTSPSSWAPGCAPAWMTPTRPHLPPNSRPPRPLYRAAKPTRKTNLGRFLGGGFSLHRHERTWRPDRGRSRGQATTRSPARRPLDYPTPRTSHPHRAALPKSGPPLYRAARSTWVVFSLQSQVGPWMIRHGPAHFRRRICRWLAIMVGTQEAIVRSGQSRAAWPGPDLAGQG